MKLKRFPVLLFIAALVLVTSMVQLRDPAPGSSGMSGDWTVSNEDLTGSSQVRRIYEHYQRAARARANDQLPLALTEIDLATMALAGLPVPGDAGDAKRQRRVKLLVYLAKARYHNDAWQYVSALEAYEQGMAVADSEGRRQTIEGELRRLRGVVDELNGERNQGSRYRASPDMGPARVLAGRVAAINLFVEDGSSGAWGLKQRDFMRRARSRAEDWLRQAARHYAGDVHFRHRDFVLNRSPELKRMTLSNRGRARFRQGELLMRKAVRELGERTVRDFVQRIREEEGADQVVMVVYLPRKGRSWARRCYGRCSLPAEYTVLMVSPRASHWQRAEYAWAHESLHLFGADDLYNVRGAKYYAPRDIMNYPSRVLMASTLEPLTAFAVGLQPAPPPTPFPILQDRIHGSNNR